MGFTTPQITGQSTVSWAVCSGWLSKIRSQKASNTNIFSMSWQDHVCHLNAPKFWQQVAGRLQRGLKGINGYIWEMRCYNENRLLWQLYVSLSSSSPLSVVKQDRIKCTRSSMSIVYDNAITYCHHYHFKSIIWYWECIIQTCVATSYAGK